MKFNYIFISILILFLGSCEHNPHTDETKAEATESASEEIVFSPERASHFGVKTTKIVSGNFSEIIQVTGEISRAQGEQCLVSSSSAGIISLKTSLVVGARITKGSAIGSISSQQIVGGDTNEQARITYHTAKKELERITPLFHDRIITEREYNAAKDAFEKARIAYRPSSPIGTSPTSPISGVVSKLFVTDGQFVNVGDPIAEISTNQKLILRADVPEKYVKFVSSVHDANFKTSYSEKALSISALSGRIVDNGNNFTNAPGYVPVFFEFKNNGELVPGTYADIFLIGNTKEHTISLPLTAITEEQGDYFVYVKIDAEGYLKRQVTLGVNDGSNIEILSGLKEGEEVVTAGAILIKLASQSGAVPAHSHEH